MAINAKRLLKLADYLETVPRKAFNIQSWESRAANKQEGKNPGECGFAGCAVGWAAHAKLFRGLRMEDGFPIYKDTFSWPAVSDVFGLGRSGALPSHDAAHLFSPHTYPKGKATPKQVATRIRKFVRDHSKVAP